MKNFSFASQFHHTAREKKFSAKSSCEYHWFLLKVHDSLVFRVVALIIWCRIYIPKWSVTFSNLRVELQENPTKLNTQQNQHPYIVIRYHVKRINTSWTHTHKWHN